jgi:hypothetical protein
MKVPPRVGGILVALAVAEAACGGSVSSAPSDASSPDVASDVARADGLAGDSAIDSGVADSGVADSGAVDSGVTDSTTVQDTGALPTDASLPQGCSVQALDVAFGPMYSAYDGTHVFQIPAIVRGISGSAITWSSSNPAMVLLAPDLATGGIVITVQQAGSVSIVATAGGLCGSSLLTITQANSSDWQIGNARYNDGVAIHFGFDGGGTSMADGGPACTSCHGPTGTGAFADFAWTPEQSGGYSDQDLVGIIVNGNVPDGGYYDPSIVPENVFHSFHQWTDITQDEQLGMVVYLRSLTPASEGDGGANFWGQ